MNSEQLRQQQIESIQAISWNKFIDWQNMTGARLTLDIPDDIAPVLIPRRILEISQNPTAVNVVIYRDADNKRPTRSNISFTVFERMAGPITDERAFNAWLEGIKGQKAIILPNSHKESPDDIDYKHLHVAPLIKKGAITFSDRIYFAYGASINFPEYPDVVFTVNYSDRSDLNRQGIGTSFYQQWERILRSLGFKYLLGNIISPHPNFFRKTGRKTYQELNEEVKKNLPPFAKMGGGVPSVPLMVKEL